MEPTRWTFSVHGRSWLTSPRAGTDRAVPTALSMSEGSSHATSAATSPAPARAVVARLDIPATAGETIDLFGGHPVEEALRPE
jgi:hypothetical protein